MLVSTILKSVVRCSFEACMPHKVGVICLGRVLQRHMYVGVK